MKVRPSTFFTIVIILIVGAAIFIAKDFPVGALVFPLMIGVITLAMCLLLLFTELRQVNRGHRVETSTGIATDIGAGDLPARVVARRGARAVLWILVLYIGIWLLGLKISAVSFLIAYAIIEARARWPMILGMTAIMLTFLFAFERLLEVFWPEGLLGKWLGGSWPWLF